MPFDNEVLYLDHKKISDYIIKSFEKKTKDLIDNTKINELRKELDDKMEKV